MKSLESLSRHPELNIFILWAKTWITVMRHNIAEHFCQRCYLKSPATKSAFKYMACLVNILYLAHYRAKSITVTGKSWRQDSPHTHILHKTKRHQRALNRISWRIYQTVEEVFCPILRLGQIPCHLFLEFTCCYLFACKSSVSNK